MSLKKIMHIVFIIWVLLLLCFSLHSTEQPEMVIQLGHSMEINAVCFSPDERYILSASSDTSISLWDVYTGKEIRKLTGHTGFVYAVCFSPDGRYALSSGRDHNIILWNVETGEAIKTFTDKTANVLALVFLLNGNSALLARSDHTIMLLDILSGNITRVFSGHSSFINAIAISPDGNYFLSGGGDANVILWDIEKENPVRIFRGHIMGIHAVAFSPDNKHILSGGGLLDKAEMILWDRESGKKLKSFSGHNGYITSVHFSPDRTSVVSAGYDKTIKIWDIPTGKELRTLTAHPAAIKSACFSPGHSYFLSADAGRTVILWHADTWREIRRFKGYSGQVKAVCYSPDGRYIVTGGEAGVLALWDLEQGRKTGDFKGHEWEIQSVCFSPDGTQLLSAGNDKTVKLWDVQTGVCLKTFEGHKGFVFSVRFSPDGKYGLSGGIDNSIILWDIAAGIPVYTIKGHTNYVASVAFSPDGNFFVSGSADKTIVLWETKRGYPVNTFLGHTGGVSSVCISPDGTKILSGGYSQQEKVFTDGSRFVSGITYQAKLWDIKTGKELRTFSGYTWVVETVCFSKDGKQVFSGSWDSTIKQWDIATGREIAVYKDHIRQVNDIAISPCGNYLLSGSNDSRAVIRNLTTGETVSLVSSDNLTDWLIYSRDGYWDSSGQGGQLVAMVRGMDAWNIDQFAVKNNRPDILLEKIGSTNRTLINHYYTQYTKRLKKTKINEDSLSKTPHVPFVSIKNVTTRDKYATLQCLFKDTHYTIVSYNIYVNDVPLFGAYGKPAAGKEINITEKIELSEGENKIEVACLNETGAESYRALAYASYDRKVKGDLYFIGFGVSDYKNPGLNLNYADKDVKDLADIFGTMKNAYGKIHIKTYLDKEVTPAVIKNAGQFLKNSSVDDTFVLFISGHGVHDTDDDATYYYLTHDTDVHNLPGTAATFELIENLLHETCARKKLFLMDTCESGEIEDDIRQDYYEMADAKGLAARTTKRGLLVTKNKEKRSYLFDRDRYIYNDLLRRSGAIVFSSSRGGELSYESDQYKNGLFSWAIISCLKDKKADTDGNGIIMIDELQAYVGKTVPELTRGMQHPTIDRDNIYLKFGLPCIKVK
ncbi:MAG: caspase family protein [Spirochaetales bacterium]|nr:caspase family protein [Spirochaetales bacterium]